MKYIDEFTESKHGISILTQDLNYINSEENFLEAVSTGTCRQAEQSGINIKIYNNIVDCYLFFKINDNSEKIDKQTRNELMKDMKE